MEGRARDQRDDGRRGHAPARVPRDPRAGETARGRGVDPLPAARRTAPGATSAADPATSRRRSSPTSRCGWPATTRRSRTCVAPPSASRAARRPRAGARVHPHLAGAVRRLALGPGAGAAAGDDAAAGRGSRSTSTTSPAGRARRSSRCRSCSPCARSARCRSRSTSCAAPEPWSPPDGGIADRPRRWSRSTASCRLYQRRPLAPLRRVCAARGRSAGSSTARRPTAAGAGSSRRGSTR